MTYISAGTTYDRSEVIVWERGDDGRRYQKRYTAPYYFYVPDEDGEYEDIYNVKLTRLEFDDQPTFYQTAQRFKNEGVKVYESDISVEYKVLSTEYFGKIPGKLNTTFFDIEVDYDPARGFSSPANPYAPINAISIYHRHLECFKVYAVPPKTGKWTMDMIPDDLKALATIVLCKDEKELLMYILEEFEDSDIISGWNSEGFDVPYIYERLKKVYGEKTAARLSFADARPPKYKEVKGKFGKVEQVLQIFGRVHIDYMLLMKKFEPGERDSMALEAVTEVELPELPKLHYEGTLAQLYNNDFLHFLRYNIRDSECLKGFEDKKGFMSLAVILSHMDAGFIQDVIGTIKLTELSMINYCHHTLNMRVHDTNKDIDPSAGKFGGAKVLTPLVGLHDWVGSIDVTSLYPSAMRSINISPEVLMGQFTGKDDDFHHVMRRSDRELTAEMSDGEFLCMTAIEWADFLDENNYSLSGYGTMFDQSRQGIIPALLTSWFAQRKEYKKKSAEAQKEYLRLKAAGLPYTEVKDQASYYDKVQNIFKLKLNSTYGACGNQHFKFFDIRLAESTTKTGQEILFHMARTIGQILEGEYSYPNASVIYGDTDSCYFKTHGENLEEAFHCANVIAKRINKSFPEFCERMFFCKGESRNIISVAQEIVANKGIFAAGKKSYMLRVLKLDGNDVDKIKITGLPMKKTTTPKPVRVKLAKYMERFMKGEAWDTVGVDFLKLKEDLEKSDDVTLLGLPRNVNNVEDYVARYNNAEAGLRVPGHVKAAMFWNKCKTEYNDNESLAIVSGMKIRVLYLTKPFNGFTNIAIPVDLRAVPEWFNEHFLKLIDKKKQSVRLVNMPMKSVLLAIGEMIPTRKKLMIDDMFD